MRKDDRRFHDQGIHKNLWNEGTKLSSPLNILWKEFENLFKKFSMSFDDRNNENNQFSELFDKFSDKLLNDIANKTDPVGTVIFAAMSLSQFTEAKPSSQTWVYADGSPAPDGSAYHRSGLGYLENGKRYLPDGRKYFRVPTSQSDLNKNRGILDDTVNPSGISLKEGRVSTNVGFNDSEIHMENTTVQLNFRYASGTSRADGNDVRWNPAYPGFGPYTSGEAQIWSQKTLIDLDAHGNTGHHHVVRIDKRKFSGDITSISFNGGSETRPKTQLINAFVRIN